MKGGFSKTTLSRRTLQKRRLRIIQGEGSLVAYFRGKEKITTYARVGNIDSTKVKIFSVVEESFEKK
jgi:hypothetical protein